MEGNELITTAIKQIIGMVDLFDEVLDVEELEKMLSALKDNHCYNQTVSVIAVACGGEVYDDETNIYMIDEMQAFIDLIKARKGLINHVMKKSNLPNGNQLYRGGGIRKGWEARGK